MKLNLLWWRKPKKPLIVEPAYCNCKSQVVDQGTATTVEVKLGLSPSSGYTNFILGKCVNCGGAIGFPEANMELAVNAYRIPTAGMSLFEQLVLSADGEALNKHYGV